ncbi:hypothetical protein B0H13DRAFT_2380486 [Mycena leptocephala]|nr:hypothetical protein B0H13DRAFT_2380486 [Mycena leptocephala]
MLCGTLRPTTTPPTNYASAPASSLTTSSTASPHSPSSAPLSTPCPRRCLRRIATIVFASFELSSIAPTHLPPPHVYALFWPACGQSPRTFRARTGTRRAESELLLASSLRGFQLLVGGACPRAFLPLVSSFLYREPRAPLDLQHLSLPRSRTPDSHSDSRLASLANYDLAMSRMRTAHYLRR